jgi:hypothetical protein
LAGTPSDSYSAYQSDWNVDTFDYVPNRFSGSNPSKLKLDFTKTQILVIQAQWLGVGRVVVGFDVDGVIYPAHIFYNANRLVLPYTQSFNLPVRMEARNVGGNIVSRTGYFDASNGVFLETTSTAEGGTVNFVCCSVQSEGGVAVRGFAKTTSNGTVTTAVTTRRPILSIRNAATYNSLVNRAHIELAELNMIASSNSAFWEIVYGGTLTGGTWPAVGSNSIAEVNLGATAISGGVVIASGFVPAGAGSARLTSSASPDIRAPLVISKIDGLAITQPAISVVCTSLSGTSNVSAALNWYEQTI